jgi:hypothetical protein
MNVEWCPQTTAHQHLSVRALTETGVRTCMHACMPLRLCRLVVSMLYTACCFFVKWEAPMASQTIMLADGRRG